MTDVLRRRLDSHLLGDARGASLVDTARHMMAIQSQELWGGKFALSVRTSGAPTARDVDAAFDRGELVRTWPFRGTLHVLAADDVEFALTVARDRVVARTTAPHRDALSLELDDYSRAERIVRTALASGPLSRGEVFDAMQLSGLDPAGNRGTHLIVAIALRGVVHWGPPIAHETGSATQQLLRLNDDLPAQAPVPSDRDAELYRRYLRGHAPATPEDFAWWSGLTLMQARAAAAAIADDVDLDDEGRQSLRAPVVGVVRATPQREHLLPSFDEYYMSYRDRSLTCDPRFMVTVGPTKNGRVEPILVRDGEVIATWKRDGAVVANAPHEVDSATALTRYREHIS
ncbi:winged helix DNA-binding domain-containing protein [Microbacterium mitrae]|uniref:Winged helix DNA-binding domain-containing protein n=1 Tax=Microbacterium mitrae TaxID=664640 RepID=A0A5C8HRM3_9MICO|nr:crosslink repair DNA glycosylase YcaQ family protein [Microbacterium mitrae]TXK06157.1 winged helix DNA-binding domain-containing protein [Microbacterium mitrae]